jgi:hypothetical protein
MKKLLSGPWFFILFTLGCLSPFFILAAFNHPAADDFTVTYTVNTKGFWDAQVYWYFKWTGRYISTAIVSLLQPLVYKSIFLYRIYPVLLLLGTLLSTHHLLRSLFVKVETKKLWAICSIITIALISILPSIVQGYYWVPGSLIYMLANIFTLLFASYLIKFEINKDNKYLLISIVCGVLAIGSNELNLFIVLFILGFWAIGHFFSARKLHWKTTATILFLGVASVLSLFAPGNAARGSVIEKTPGNESLTLHDPLFALSKSVHHGLSDIVNWVLFSPLLIVCIIIFLKHSELKSVLKTTIHPAIIWLGLICLYFFLYFPYYYGTGNPDSSTFPSRTSNVICFFICISVPISILYTLKWFEEIKRIRLELKTSNRIFQGLSVAFVIIILVTGNMKMVLKDLRSRDFIAYNRELNSRYDLIARSSADTLVVDSLHFFPRTIYMGDISADPGNWINAPYAKYFGKKLIRLKNSEDTENEREVGQK